MQISKSSVFYSLFVKPVPFSFTTSLPKIAFELRASVLLSFGHTIWYVSFFLVYGNIVMHIEQREIPIGTKGNIFVDIKNTLKTRSR